jgi:hypothetical protein
LSKKDDDNSASEIQVLFDFFKKSQVLEIVEVMLVHDQGSSFYEMEMRVSSTINHVPCFQKLKVRMSKNAIKQLLAALPKGS